MPFQILSLSGGGYLGLYTISVLAALEKKCGRPIAQSFDLIAGTSVGGIIALGLALEKPAAEIQAAFERNGEAIFSDRAAPSTRIGEMRDVMRYMNGPKYSDYNLRKTIIEITGADTKLGAAKHPVMIPTINVTKGRPQVFKTPHHNTFVTDLHRRVVDVALATSAAPTYFPLAQVEDSLFADGGLYGNSPDILAMHEAEHFFGIAASNIRVLSVGTTTSQFSFSHAGGRDYGLLQWAAGQRLVQTAISSQQQVVDYMMKHKLSSRYVRIDSTQSKEQERDIGLDVATEAARKTIRGLAQASVQDWIVKKELCDILEYTAPAPKFFHTL